MPFLYHWTDPYSVDPSNCVGSWEIEFNLYTTALNELKALLAEEGDGIWGRWLMVSATFGSVHMLKRQESARACCPSER